MVESTAGGLITASLLSVPRASRYFGGSMTIYSASCAKALLPVEVLKQLGRPEDNYASPDAYKRSKEVFTLVLARHARDMFGTTWAVAEAGATLASTLPKRLRSCGAFSCVSVVGPGVERTCFLEGTAHREENMWLFARQALHLLEAAVPTQAKL